MCQREVMVDWLGSEFGGESLSGHCHSIEQLLRPRSAALVQPGTQLRKMEKGADGLDQTDAGNACFPISDFTNEEQSKPSEPHIPKRIF